MDSRQVKKIMHSTAIRDVYYQGRPVWVEGMFGSLAEVRFRDNGDRLQLPVSVLTNEKE